MYIIYYSSVSYLAWNDDAKRKKKNKKEEERRLKREKERENRKRGRFFLNLNVRVVERYIVCVATSSFRAWSLRV